MIEPITESAEIVVSWTRANHTALAAALTDIRAQIERYLSDEPTTQPPAGPRGSLRLVDGNGQELPSSLDTLCRFFELSAMERDIVLLCLGMEVDSGFGELCARVHGKDDMSYPTLCMALKVFGERNWSVCSPHGALRRWNIIEVGQGKGRVFQPISLDERILDYLLDHHGMDTRLAGFIKPLPVPTDDAGTEPTQRDAVDRAARVLTQPRGAAATVAFLCGAEVVQSRTVAARACQRLGCALHVVSLDNLPRDPTILERFLRLWHREAILSQSVLLIERFRSGGVSAALSPALGQVLDQIEVPVLVSGPALPSSSERPLVRIDVPRAQRTEQAEPWSSALLGRADDGPG